MADKKAYPVGGQPPTGYVPAPPQAAYGGGASYGVFPSQAQLYAAQGPPPSYDQTLQHPGAAAQAAQAAAVNQQMYAQMYAQAAQAQVQAAQAQAQGYPAGYLGYPAYSPMQAYYPSLAYTYPGIQQAQMRQTIMVPGCYCVEQNGFDAGARFDGISQQGIPAAPPGVAPNAAQLAAMAGHNVALSQKKGSFLAGGSEGGYTFW